MQYDFSGSFAQNTTFTKEDPTGTTVTEIKAEQKQGHLAILRYTQKLPVTERVRLGWQFRLSTEFSNQIFPDRMVYDTNTGWKPVGGTETVTTINSNAFYNCSSLKNVKFSEGLVNLYSYAFYNCKRLTEIVLPSSLEKCQDAPFYGCSGVKKVEARSVIPPTTSGRCPLSNVTLNDVVLYVPSWSTSEYPLADGWSPS